MRRKYCIVVLSKQTRRDLRFELAIGETMTMRDYFGETYKLQLHYDFSVLPTSWYRAETQLSSNGGLCIGGQVAAVVVWQD